MKILLKFKIYILTIVVSIISGIFIYYRFSYLEKYKSISVETVSSSTIEFGTANYDISNIVSSVSGRIVSIKKDIDTNKIGSQKLVLQVVRDNVYKDVAIDVEIVDSVAPIINIDQKEIKINQGDDLDLFSNIKYVYDFADGEIPYLEYGLVTDEACGYYTVTTDFNKNVCGLYKVVVIAVDKHGNKSSEEFEIVVENAKLSAQVVDIALSLVGSPYVYGGTGPSGFDCSGFIQYVYAQKGIFVSRSASTQIFDGYGVSYDDILPGDIISWGYSNGVVTHSALYIGDGKMVHAANPAQGVLISSVENWTNTSGVQILGIRRIS